MNHTISHARQEPIPPPGLIGGPDVTEEEIKYRHALESVEKALGLDHPVTLDTIIMLGETLLVPERYGPAKVVCRYALAGREKALGEDHASTLVSADSLGRTRHNQGGGYGEAEVKFRYAYTGRGQPLGPYDVDTILSFHGSGEDTGPDHPFSLECVNMLGETLVDLKKHEEMEIIKHDEVEVTYRRAFVVLCVCNLAGVLYKWGKYYEAETMNRRARTGQERVPRPDRPHTLR
ncbi:hypothetical protein HOY82DRAFT_622048 [Tuber indicum]|nr:hypothetical protein HOY82DRAFT_622048 [Tuber indicum]